MENPLEEAKIEGRSGGEVTDFYVHANHLGSSLNVHFDSVGLGWGLWHCVSNKFWGEYDNPGHGPHLNSKS